MPKGNRGGKRAGGGNINQTEKDAVFEYTTSKFQQINGGLRKGENLSKTNQNIVNNIDSAINKSTLDANTVLYRGTSPEALGISKDIKKMTAQEVKDLVGKNYTDKAFLSFSKEKSASNTFSGRGEYKGNVEITLQTKGKRKGLDVGDNSNFGAGESEVILPRNANLKIVSAKRYLNKLSITVEY